MEIVRKMLNKMETVSNKEQKVEKITHFIQLRLMQVQA